MKSKSMAFCTNCGYKVESEWEFCAICGHHLKKKKIQYPAEGILFTMKKMNWEPADNMTDEKTAQTWVIYRDGRVYSYASYCVSGDSDSQKGQLDKKEFRELGRLLRKFRKIPGAGEGCSGETGYEMTIYNTEGAEEHRFYGYIRGNKCLKRLSNLICDIPGFYFGEYGPACRIIFN